jgi:hypothetical protein
MENRKVKQVLSQGGGMVSVGWVGYEERVNMVEISCTPVYKRKKETC